MDHIKYQSFLFNYQTLLYILNFMAKLLQLALGMLSFKVQKRPYFSFHLFCLVDLNYSMDVLVIVEEPVVAIDAVVF